MSPLDAHLRDMLHEQAETLDVPADLLDRVNARARGLRRRRAAVASVAAAAAVAGVVGAGAWLADGPDPRDAPIAVQPTPTATATSAPARLLQWPYRTGDGVAALDLASSAHPLWAGRVGTSTVVVGQRVDAAGRVRSHAWVTPASGAPYEQDGVRLTARTCEVSFVLPGGATPWVLVVGGPSTGQILYAADGSTFKPETTRDGVAWFPRTGPSGSDPDGIWVLDGNGDMSNTGCRGPIDTGSASPDK